MTNMQTTDGIVLKADEKEHVRIPAARRENLLDEFEWSGLNWTTFAALACIKYPTFAAWASRRRRQRDVSAPATVKPVDPAPIEVTSGAFSLV